jgi:RES domain-containing protein
VLAFSALQKALTGCPRIRVKRAFYRNVDFAYVTTLLSAIGSFKTGGRYNVKKGFEAMYLAQDPVVALFEVESIIRVGRKLHAVKLPPRIALTIDVDFREVLDLTDRVVRRRLSLTVSELKEPWKPFVLHGFVAPTQTLGRAVRAAGFEAILAPSAKMRGATNLVVFPDRMYRTSSYRIFEPGHLVDIMVSGRR